MANQFGSPIVIDTVGATSTFPQRIRVLEVSWVGATTPGHEAVIEDPVSGRPLWQSKAPGANFVERDEMDVTWKNGFTVPTLGSGKLFIRVG